VDRIQDEAVWLGCPDRADAFAGRDGQPWAAIAPRAMAAEGLEPAGEVVGCHEVRRVGAELVVIVVMEAFDGRVLDRPVHPLDLPIRPRVVWLREAVLDTARPCPRTNGGHGLALADHVKAHGPGIDGVAGPWLLGELNTVIGENGVDLIGHRLEHVLQELPSRLPVRLVDELGQGKLACAVDVDEQKQLALSGLHLGDVDVKEADGVALELLQLRLVALQIRQPGNAVSRAGHRCSAERVRRGMDGCKAYRRSALQTIPRIACFTLELQRQQRVPPERDDGRLLILGQARQARLLRPGLEIRDTPALSPFSNGLRVDPQIPAQRRERSLRSFGPRPSDRWRAGPHYCSSDSVRGRGASMANLAHNASFHS